MALPKTPSFRLDGKRALVTGASRGIGLGCGVALAEAGAHVVMAARSADALDSVVAEMVAQGLSATAVALDVTDLTAQERVLDTHGPFDIVLNSAGMARNIPAFDTTPADFDVVANINIRAAYFLAVNAAKRMTNGGSIIQISSQMGHVGGQERSVYCGTKHAIEGMCKAQAIEWGKLGIRVNSICPTFIRTPLTEPTFSNPEKLAWVMSNIKLDRVGAIEDIMGAAVFLASDAAAMITGTGLLVDGGWTAS